MKFKLFLTISIFLFASIGTAYAGGDPSSAIWTLYKVYLYENADCTGTPQTILDNSDGENGDFVSNPTLSTATIDNGTYNCVAVSMSDTITFIPSTNEGTECVADTAYTMGVCQSQFTSTDADTGLSSSCTDGEDTVWVYISTLSTSTVGSEENNSFAPPTESNTLNGINLGNALTVDGDTTATFVIDTTGTIDTYGSGPEGSDECGMEQPLFSFQ